MRGGPRAKSCILMRTIFLDAGPLGTLIYSKPQSRKEIGDWMRSMREAGAKFALTSVADYEVRRELIRMSQSGKDKVRQEFAKRAIVRLDEFIEAVGYLSLSQEVLHCAAEMWGDMRRRGLATCDDKELDCDVILCAHAKVACGKDGLIATSNDRHIGHLADNAEWHAITVADLTPQV